MPRTHHLPAEVVHYRWDIANEAVLEIESGDTVVLWTRDVSDNQIGPGSDASVLANFDWDRAYPLTGPIAVHGAEPGDTLQIEMLDVHTQGWGWTGVIAGSGLLREDFPDAYIKTFDLSRGDVTYFREDIAIPLEPYFGTMGVCPAGAHMRNVLPPGTFGGNMDIRQTVKGSTVWLPIEVENAMFSCGDAHGAQGDGEVCVTAIEAPMFGALRFTLKKGQTIPAPLFRTPAPLTRRVDSAPFYGTTGVNGGQYIVSALLPEAIFTHTPASRNGRALRPSAFATTAAT